MSLIIKLCFIGEFEMGTNHVSPLQLLLSEKIVELGFERTAKKCKDKLENLYKYHKRTKEGRVVKLSNKTYQFLDQLEGLETMLHSQYWSSLRH